MSCGIWKSCLSQLHIYSACQQIIKTELQIVIIIMNFPWSFQAFLKFSSLCHNRGCHLISTSESFRMKIACSLVRPAQDFEIQICYKKLWEISKVHNSKVCLALWRSSLSLIPESHFNLRRLVQRCRDATDMPDLVVDRDEPSVSYGNNDSDNSWPTK